MSSIAPEVSAIRSAIYGRDVRESIARGLEKLDENIGDDVSSLNSSVSTIQATISTIQNSIATIQGSISALDSLIEEDTNGLIIRL